MTPIDEDYCREIANDFIEKRGHPTMLLTSAEFALIKRWRDQKYPLRIVLRGIQDCFESKPKDRKVVSLYYVERSVEDAISRWGRSYLGTVH